MLNVNVFLKLDFYEWFQKWTKANENEVVFTSTKNRVNKEINII